MTDPDLAAALYPSAVARLTAGLRDVVQACDRGDVPSAIAPLAANALADVARLQTGAPRDAGDGQHDGLAALS